MTLYSNIGRIINYYQFVNIQNHVYIKLDLILVYGHYVEFVKENLQKSVGRGTSVGHGKNRLYQLAPKEYVKPKVRNIELCNKQCFNVHIL